MRRFAVSFVVLVLAGAVVLAQVRTINSLEELTRVAVESPTSPKYDLYKVGERFTIYYFQVKSFDSMLDYLGRVLIWSDLQGLPGLGDGVLNNLDDHVEDGVLDMKDIRAAVMAAWGPSGGAYGVTYDLAHVVKVFNAHMAMKTPHAVFNQKEREFLSELERLGLIEPIGVGYRIVKPAAVVMVQPLANNPSLPVFSNGPATVLRHEMSHAVMYQEPRFRAAARSAWESLKPVEQQAIKKRLKIGGLNVENFELLIEEFAAYAEEGFEDPLFTSSRMGQPLDETVSATTLARLKDALAKSVGSFSPFAK